MSYSLADYAKDEKEPLRKGLMQGLAIEGLIADIMTWRSIDSMSETGTRYDDVPTPSFIPINGTIAEATVTGHQITHSVYRMAHHMDIPVPLEDTTADLLAKPSTQQTKLALKGAAYVINDKFINGNRGTDPNEFDGLNALVGQLASTQTVTPAAEIDLVVPTTDEINDFIDLIELGMHRVDGHKPTAGFTNSQVLLKIESCLRRAGLMGDNFNWKEHGLEVDDPRVSLNSAATKPAFMWRGVPFYNMGVKGDQTTQIMLNNYSDGASSGTGSRIFFVKFGDDQVEGIQSDPLNIRPIGLLEASDVYRFRLTWSLGTALWGPRSISKVGGFRVA